MKFQTNVKQYNRSKLFSAGMIGILCVTVCKKNEEFRFFFASDNRIPHNRYNRFWSLAAGRIFHFAILGIVSMRQNSSDSDRPPTTNCVDRIMSC